MNEKDKLKINNQQSLVEDLVINEDQAAAVKGGAVVHGTTVLAWARVDGQSR